MTRQNRIHAYICFIEQVNKRAKKQGIGESNKELHKHIKVYKLWMKEIKK